MMSLVTKRGDDGLVHYAYGEGFGVTVCSQSVGGRSSRYLVNAQELLRGAWPTCFWCVMRGENDVRIY